MSVSSSSTSPASTRASRRCRTASPARPSVSATTARCAGLAACLILAVLLWSPVAQAQSGFQSAEPSSRQGSVDNAWGNAPARSSGTNTARLPEWARPSSPSSNVPSNGRRPPGDASPPGVATTNGGPIKPGVPIDGGLVWLSLAGAGYATKKLYDGRREEG